MTLVLNGTTGVSSVDGSASTPAIQGTDSNTGVFFPAADTVAIATGGTERVRTDSSGNVGIGTSSPAYKLDVSGNGRVTGDFYVGASTNIIYESSSNFNVRAANALLFLTNGANERARIDSSGNLLVGTTSQVAQGKINVVYSNNSHQGLCFNENSGSGLTRDAVRFQTSGTQVGSISVSTTATAYNTSSDYRLKEDIQPMTGALARVTQLKPVTYKWKSSGEAAEGFIAHELQAVVPDCVTGEKDAVDAEGNPIYQGIDTSFLVATLTAAIQEQQALIAALQADVAALKGAQA